MLCEYEYEYLVTVNLNYNIYLFIYFVERVYKNDYSSTAVQTVVSHFFLRCTDVQTADYVVRHLGKNSSPKK